MSPLRYQNLQNHFQEQKAPCMTPPAFFNGSTQSGSDIYHYTSPRPSTHHVDFDFPGLSDYGNAEGHPQLYNRFKDEPFGYNIPLKEVTQSEFQTMEPSRPQVTSSNLTKGLLDGTASSFRLSRHESCISLPPFDSGNTASQLPARDQTVDCIRNSSHYQVPQYQNSQKVSEPQFSAQIELLLRKTKLLIQEMAVTIETIKINILH
jgi:hypothetical protein